MTTPRPRLLLALTLLLGAWHASTTAQELRAQFMPPLVTQPVAFEPQAKEEIGFFTSVANTAFKPKGEGPFPAVVLMHTCGGVRDPHIKQHAQELLQAGYVVLVVDSFGPRGMQNCSTGVLSGSAGVADAYAGLAFLAARPFVDQGRIYQVGYSWGAIVSTMLASPQSAAYAGSAQRFAATVSHYSNCVHQGKYHFVLRDTDRPVLMLIGGRDTELPPAACFPLLDELKAAGQPVQWHVFPEATHAWDKATLPARGYVHDAQVTQDATARMLAFLAQAR